MSESEKNKLENEIKQLIIDSLALEDISISDIDSQAPLFSNEGLGLDSVDALELGLAIQKHFSFQLNGETQELRNSFANVASLAQFIIRHQGN